MALANSQTAHAWLAVNEVTDGAWFLPRGSETCHIEHYDDCPSHEGAMALWHIRSCGQDQTECGAGRGQYIHLVVYLKYGTLRLLYPDVHVPPHGIVRFIQSQSAGVQYTTSDDELFPSVTPIPLGDPVCQKVIRVQDPHESSFITFPQWFSMPQTWDCDNAPDRARVP